MARRVMFAAAEHHDDHDQKDQDERNDRTHLHPARCTWIGGRLASCRGMDFVSSVRGRGGVCHVRVLQGS